MFETTIQFKPREQWRAGHDARQAGRGARSIVRVPGLANIWVPPIRNRIDMLATGIKSPVGIQGFGSGPGAHRRPDRSHRRRRQDRPRRVSALAERLTGGRYIDIDIDRKAIARYGLSIDDVQAFIGTAVGGGTSAR
jgi:Cu(I)/Ag(I) efflux system membrane protein CusA/SilA